MYGKSVFDKKNDLNVVRFDEWYECLVPESKLNQISNDFFFLCRWRFHASHDQTFYFNDHTCKTPVVNLSLLCCVCADAIIIVQVEIVFGQKSESLLYQLYETRNNIHIDIMMNCLFGVFPSLFFAHISHIITFA